MKTLSKIEANKLFNTGKWISTENISAIYLNSDEFKYMVSAPIKKYKRAVERNKIKRLLRNSIFENKQKNVTIAFIYKGNIKPDQVTIKKEIKYIYEKI